MKLLRSSEALRGLAEGHLSRKSDLQTITTTSWQLCLCHEKNPNEGNFNLAEDSSVFYDAFSSKVLFPDVKINNITVLF